MRRWLSSSVVFVYHYKFLFLMVYTSLAKIPMFDAEAHRIANEGTEEERLAYVAQSEIDFFDYFATIPAALVACWWLVKVPCLLRKCSFASGTLGWYITLSRMNNLKSLRRTVIIGLLLQVGVWCLIAWMANSLFEGDLGVVVRSLMSPIFLGTQFLQVLVFADMYSHVVEESTILKIETEDKTVANLPVNRLECLVPNEPNQIRELLEDAALHFLIMGSTSAILKADAEITRQLEKILGADGKEKFITAVLRNKDSGGRLLLEKDDDAEEVTVEMVPKSGGGGGGGLV
jgi:hypothetical protein